MNSWLMMRLFDNVIYFQPSELKLVSTIRWKCLSCNDTLPGTPCSLKIQKIKWLLTISSVMLWYLHFETNILSMYSLLSGFDRLTSQGFQGSGLFCPSNVKINGIRFIEPTFQGARWFSRLKFSLNLSCSSLFKCSRKMINSSRRA